MRNREIFTVLGINFLFEMLRYLVFLQAIIFSTFEIFGLFSFFYVFKIAFQNEKDVL